MLKDKLNKMYAEMVQTNKSIGFTDTKNNICGQMWNNISLGDRIEIMSMRKKEYKTISANLKACVKIMEGLIEA